MKEREVSVGEFRAGTREALAASDESSRSWGSNRSNWLVTVASALIAVPVFAGNDLAFKSRCLWGLFVLADLAFVGCIILVVVRTELFLRRLNRNMTTMAEVLDSVVHLQEGDTMPPPRPEWVTGLEEVVSNRRQERRMDIAALSFFLAGILLLTVVLLIQTYPR